MDFSSIDWEWDDEVIEHIARHGLDPDIVYEIYENSPKFFVNYKKHKEATHMMIGPDNGNSFWTIFIKPVDVSINLWKVITGWKSSQEHITKYRRKR